VRRRRIASAAVVAPILFLCVVAAQDLLRPGFHPQSQFISELAAGPYGWIQIVNFVVLGAVILAFAGVMRRALAPSRPRVGIALLALIGIGVEGCALFQADPWPPSSMSLEGILHLACAVVLVFTLLPVCCFALARAFAGDARLRGLAGYTRVTGAATLVLFAGGLALMSPPGSPPRVGNWYGGLIQRADVTVFLIWLTTVAARLRAE
jgi:hypothetical protein